MSPKQIGGDGSASPDFDTPRSTIAVNPDASDADLQRVVAAWPDLPPAIRRAVLALIESDK